MSKQKKCKYYPCHKIVEDCTFCYCLIYPCKSDKTGGKWIKNKKNKLIWDCSDCTIIHTKKFVRNIRTFFKKHKEIYYI